LTREERMTRVPAVRAARVTADEMSMGGLEKKKEGFR
jgi:hypothetical protein